MPEQPKILPIEPIFTRGEVAKILNVTPQTIVNREKKGLYPNSKRDVNNYRIYTVGDIFNLQLISSNFIDPRPILAVLYDKGYRDKAKIGKLFDKILSGYTREGHV